jgi:ubiquinone/menaquinone biosynthesis C-methylase UbiE
MANLGDPVHCDSPRRFAAGFSASRDADSQTSSEDRARTDHFHPVAHRALQRMIQRLIDAALWRRAHALADRIAPFLGDAASVIDIGCGTGHNAAALMQRCSAAITEADVVNMKTVGPTPLLLRDGAIATPDNSFDCGLLFFVLHYPTHPLQLLREVRRICNRVVVLQSTYATPFERMLLRCREWMQGRGAFAAARCVRFVPQVKCPLTPSAFMQQDQLRLLFRQAGLRVVHHATRRLAFTSLSRDLFVLERSDHD